MTKVFNVSMKVLALFLAVLSVAYLLPMTVFGEMVAASGSETESTSETAGNEMSAPPEQLLGESYFAPEEEIPVDALCEDTAKRESNVKQFLMSDGSYTMAVYAQNVHYMDENGEWQDIDNTLTDSGSEFSNANARVKFSKKITGNETIFTLHEHNRKITVSLVGAVKKTAGTVTNKTTDHGENATELQKMTTLDKLSANVLYADILENTDIEYLLNGSDIKENIIIKAKGEEYVYVFTLSLNNLTARLEGNEVLLCDGGEHVYTIPAPFMLDANGARSDSVTYALTDGGNGKYTLTVTADASWINAEERAFPVTVDPAITTTETVSVTIETATAFHTTQPGAYDGETYEYTVFDNSLQIGYSLDALYYRGFVAISGLDMHLDTPYILNAYLNLRQNQYGDWNQYGDIEEDTPLGLVILQCGAWTPGELCWSNQPIAFENSSVYSHTANSSDNGASCAFEITDYLKYILSTSSNASLYLTLRTFNDYIGLPSSDYCNRSFYTETDTGNEPTLTIRYKNKTGIESYWSATSHSAGFAGSGSVNNETGELTFVIDTLSSTDSILPLGVQLVYNGIYSNEYVTSQNSVSPYEHSLAGKGYRLNIQQSLLKRVLGGVVCYVMTDADGTEHLFIPTEEACVYTDVDGLGLTLDTSGTENYIVTDKQHTVYTYDLYNGNSNEAFLTQIEDSNGNKLKITPNNNYSEFRPETISVTPKGSAEITQLKLFYNNHGLIKRVYNPHTGEAYVFLYSTTYNGTSYSQDNSGYLRYVIYACGLKNDGGEISYAAETEWNSVTYNNFPSSIDDLAIARYTYDYYGLLTSAKDELQNREIRYTYDSEYRVSVIQEYASSAAGQKIGFTYGVGESSVRSSGTDDVYGNDDDLVTHYVFDGEGRTITAYTTNVDGDVLYGASNVNYVDGNEKAKNKLESSVSSKSTPPQLLVNGNFDKSFTGTNGGWVTSDSATRETEGDYTFDSGYARLKLSDSVTQSFIRQNVSLSQKSYTLMVYLSSEYCDELELKAQILLGSAVVAEKNLPLNTEMEKEGKYTDVLFFEPSVAGSYTVKLTLSSAGDIPTKNKVKIYSVILTEGIGASPVSHLDNCTFDNGASSWSVASGAASTVTVTDAGNARGYALELGSSVNTSSAKYTLFDIPLSAYDQVPGSNDFFTYTIAAWAKKSDSVKRNCNFRLRVEAVFNKYTSTDVSCVEVGVYDFIQTTSAWQYGVTSFSIDHAMGTGMPQRLMGINIYLEYDGTDGTVYFDDIVMLNGAGMVTLYAYDENGNPSVIRENTTNTYYTYTNDNRLAFMVDSEGAMTEYRYDDTNEHRLDSELNYTFTGVYKENGNDRIVRNGEIRLESYTVYGYNEYGQRTITTTYAVDIPVDGIKSELGNIVILHSVGTEDPNEPATPYDPSRAGEYIQTATTYETSDSPFFGRVISETSYLGITKYFYDEINGRLLATITYDKEMASGKGLTYTYDVLGNVLTVNPVTAASATGYTDTAEGNVDYAYNTLNQLTSITTATTVYTFTYDIYGNSSEIKMGDSTLASYTYNANNGKLNTLTYGNGVQVKYVYDELDRIEKIQYNSGENGVFETAYEYLYDIHGNVAVVIDNLSGQTITNNYDPSGKLLGSVTANGTDIVSGTDCYYDDLERIREFTFSVAELGNGTLPFTLTKQSYSYQNRTEYRNITTSHNNVLSALMTPTYDELGRTPVRSTVVSLNNVSKLTLTNSYQFATTENETSALISQYTSTVAPAGGASTNTTYKYTYDANGNITEIRNSSNVLQYRYTYDNKGQLIREDNLPLNKTYVYVYDDAGNILSQTWYGCTFTTATENLSNSVLNRVYTYDGDRMTSFKGQTVTYDSIGNPTNYRGKRMTWQQGRQLASVLTSSGTYAYAYNADGLRIGKDNGTIATEYILNGSQVMRQIISDGTTTYVADYIYHENGTPMAFAYYPLGGTPVYYFYELTLQGDIVGIYDANGAKVVGFRYNAWGSFNTDISNSTVCTDTFLRASLFRYRSYIYDHETNFYYLQSRYYDPETGRFINADGYVSTGQGLLGNNMYAYCGNNPVNRVDSTGEFWIAVLIVTAVVVCAAALSGCSSQSTPPPDYIQENSQNQNCYSYAFNLPTAANPGDFSANDNSDMMYSDKIVYTPEEITGFIERDMKALNKSVRVVSSPNDKRENEYIVAMKTSTIVLPFIGCADYHFAVQLSDGSWADKPGGKPSRWNVLSGTDSTWDLDKIKNYYNTKTVYFAVER